MTGALASAASLNESELMLRCVGWRDGSLRTRRGLYDRTSLRQIHRAHAAILNGCAAELPPLILGLRCPRSRRSARTRPTSTRPRVPDF